MKLPRGEREEPQPPAADAVEAVAHRLALPYLVGLAALAVSGRRVGELEAATVGDLDEDRRAWLVRSAVSKTKASSWGVLCDELVEYDALVEVLVGRLPARQDRDLAAALFAGVTQERLRTAIGRACRDVGVPVFSPHDLRHRRISLLHRQGVDWARIGARVGERNLAGHGEHLLARPARTAGGRLVRLAHAGTSTRRVTLAKWRPDKPQILTARVRVGVVPRGQPERDSFHLDGITFALQGFCDDAKYCGRGPYGAYVWVHGVRGPG